MSDTPPIIGLNDLAPLVGKDNAFRLMTRLFDAAEARKVQEEQEFLKAGQLDREVTHFYENECGAHISALIPPGAFIYWWLRSEQMGGQPGDFWRSAEDEEWFLKKNPGCRVRNKTRKPQSGWTPQSQPARETEPLIVLS